MRSTPSRSFSGLIQHSTFAERYQYLRLRGVVGESTFAYDRYMNQQFYRSREWRLTRDAVISRDLGCDLGVPGYEIHDRIYVHHMNPITAEDLIHGNEDILDPDFLVTVTHQTHNAIHYGDESLLRAELIPRRQGDTDLWRRR